MLFTAEDRRNFHRELDISLDLLEKGCKRVIKPCEFDMQFQVFYGRHGYTAREVAILHSAYIHPLKRSWSTGDFCEDGSRTS